MNFLSTVSTKIIFEQYIWIVNISLILWFFVPIGLFFFKFKGKMIKRLLKSGVSSLILFIVVFIIYGVLPGKIVITEISDNATTEVNYNENTTDEINLNETVNNGSNIFDILIDFFKTSENSDESIDYGKGTKKSPYKLYESSDLEKLNQYPSAYFKLMDDINYTKNEWEIINNFTGTFDGNNKVISNININSFIKEEELFYVGMFAKSSGYIKNLYLDVTIDIESDFQLTDSKLYVGGLVAYNTGSVLNSTVKSTINVNTGTNIYIGGAIGYLGYSAYIKDDYHKILDIKAISNIDVNSLYDSYVGGAIGYNRDYRLNNIETFVEMNVDSSTLANVGGVVGYSWNCMENLKSTGPISANANNVDIGGIVGRSYCDIGNISNLESLNDLTVSSIEQSYIGGIVGYSYDVEFSTVFSNQNITVNTLKESNVGGIAGSISELYNSQSNSSIKMNIDSSDNYGKLKYHLVGGLTGNASIIKDSYSTGSITVDNKGENSVRIGGISSSVSNKIENTYSNTSISATNLNQKSLVGGISATNYGEILSSISLGSFTLYNSSLINVGDISTNKFSTVENAFISISSIRQNDEIDVMTIDQGNENIRLADEALLIDKNWYFNTLLWSNEIWNLDDIKDLPVLRTNNYKD